MFTLASSVYIFLVLAFCAIFILDYVFLNHSKDVYDIYNHHEDNIMGKIFYNLQLYIGFIIIFLIPVLGITAIWEFLL